MFVDKLFLLLFLGCILVGVDQYSCMYVMKVVNTRDPVTQVPTIFIVCMLEYVLLTGLDWWDVLTAVKPGNERFYLTADQIPFGL